MTTSVLAPILVVLPLELYTAPDFAARSAAENFLRGGFIGLLVGLALCALALAVTPDDAVTALMELARRYDIYGPFGFYDAETGKQDWRWFVVPGNPAALTKMANPRRYVDAAFMEEHFRTLYGGLTGGKSEHISRLTPPTPRGYLYQLLCMIGWTSVPALPFLKKEVLIMMGDEDQIVPLINGKLLESLIPNSRLEIFEQGGHLFMLTHREQTISSLHGFLDGPDRESRKAA